MAEHNFELEAAKLFGEPQEFPDDVAFAERVDQRIERYFVLRSRVLGAVGALAALIAAVIVLRSTLVSDLLGLAGNLVSLAGEISAPAASFDVWTWPLIAAAAVVLPLAVARITRAI